jgi:P4 family phage/plasmid primase-like protien
VSGRSQTLDQAAAERRISEKNHDGRHSGSAPKKLRSSSAEADFCEEKYVMEMERRIGPLGCTGEEWFLCSGGGWQPQNRDEFKPLALKVLPPRIRTQRKAKEIFSHLEMRNQVSRSLLYGAMKFGPGGEVLIAVQNGMVRIGQTRIELSELSAEEGFTIALPVSYEPDKVAKTFNFVLSEAVPDSAEREVFLDVLATALIPDCRFEAAIVAIGEAGTGKSTVAGVIPKIFGDACSFLSMADLCHPLGYKLAMLERKAVNIGTELNALEFEDSGLFKQLVSGERFTARPIYGRPFEMQSSATMLFLTNLLPRFKYGSDAEVRRLRFVRFDHRPELPDVTLKPQVEADATGVFTELVRRAQKLLRDGKLAEQGEWGKMTADRFAVSNDPIGQFVQRCCRMGSDFRCEKSILFEKFENFRKEYALSDKLEANWFFRSLYDRFPGVKDSRIRVGGEMTRVITGIEVHEE